MSNRFLAIVCGGRDFTDRSVINGTLDACFEKYGITGIITGGARGADTLAEWWARGHDPRVAVASFPADWKTYGHRAGPIRNQEMLDMNPDVVVAFPGGRGTADMVRRATKAGVPVIRIETARHPTSDERGET